MSVTITLPRALAAKMKNAAEARNSSIEELALAILGRAFMSSRSLSPNDVVAETRSASPATTPSVNGSLADALRDAPEDPQFNLESWQREWSAVEAEMRAVSRLNALTEGRG